ncbi:MAG: hypothetical protein LBV44_00180 [Methylobacillus sp.]|jgi:hypothetical protein|nr:hypothetical protein [Methylobacillus sp.]
MSDQHRVVIVPDTAWLVFVLGLATIFILWGFFKASAFMYAALLVAPLALFFLGKTTISPQGVERQSPWGNAAIDWDEVTDIEVLPNFYWVVLNGHDKRLAIIGPAIMDTRHVDPPAWYLEELALERDIPIRLNLMAFLKRSKNVRTR